MKPKKKDLAETYLMVDEYITSVVRKTKPAPIESDEIDKLAARNSVADLKCKLCGSVNAVLGEWYLDRMLFMRPFADRLDAAKAKYNDKIKQIKEKSTADITDTLKGLLGSEYTYDRRNENEISVCYDYQYFTLKHYDSAMFGDMSLDVPQFCMVFLKSSNPETDEWTNKRNKGAYKLFQAVCTIYNNTFVIDKISEIFTNYFADRDCTTLNYQEEKDKIYEEAIAVLAEKAKSEFI